MGEIEVRPYKDETEISCIMSLISSDLSEPYSIYVYRYFLNKSPNVSFVAYNGDKMIGTVICKVEPHRTVLRGYIGMLAVTPAERSKGIALQLVTRSIEAMIKSGAEEICLETEVSNKAALTLYCDLGFLRMKRLYRYYLNAEDAYRLVLPVTRKESTL